MINVECKSRFCSLEFGVWNLELPAWTLAKRALALQLKTRIVSLRATADDGWVAQLAEQRTENPRVGGSIPPPAIFYGQFS
jgi:hypothetical protein